MKTRLKLYDQFNICVANNPDVIAIISGKNVLTYRQLSEMIDLFTANLLDRVGAGRKTLVFASAKPEFFTVAMLMASRCGHRIIFSNGDNLDEQGISYDHVLSELEPVNRAADGYIRITPDWLSGEIKVGGIAPHAVSEEAEFVFRTSGSTGKGVFYPVTDSAFVAALDTARDIYVPDRFGIRHYSTTSPAMRWTQNVAFRHLLTGGSLLADFPQDMAIFDAIDVYGVSSLAVTPHWVADALALEHPAQYLRAIRSIVVAGAYVPPALLRELQALTPARISVSYGATETGGLAAYSFDATKFYYAGYLGEICDAGFETVLFDPESGRPISGNTGLLGVRNNVLMPATGYLGHTPRAEAFRAGYFVSGDIVRKEGNALYSLGRARNVVNLDGNKFSLDEIERHLSARLPLRQVCALARSDNQGFERLEIAYVAENTLVLDAINDCLDGSLRLCKVGRAKRYAALPVTPNGKVDRAVLIAG